MNAAELQRLLKDNLQRAAIDDARFEAKLITAHVMDMEASTLSPISEIPVTQEQATRSVSIAECRINGEPLQYLLGTWDFMGLPFRVRAGVLIPRADTEILCEEALRLIQERGYRRVLDLCCGTGCIGISLAKLGGVEVTLADISETCLALSEENARMNGVSVSLIQTDLFDALQGRQFDLICCNPPYLTKEDMENLQREVRYEPELALYGGDDGLDFYRRISEQYKDHLQPDGAILLEIGNTQAEDVAQLFQTDVILNDYAGNPRVIFAEAK